MTRILVIEDDPDIRMALEDDLRLEGYEVETAANGADGASRGRDGKFDLILMDVMLPKKDGFEICRELRRAGVKTPILLLTAKTQEAEKLLGFELGADDYVTKPFSPREVRARIRALLRRSGTEQPEVIRFGDYEVDLGRYELRRGGAVVDVTPIEFGLLKAFLKNRGRTLSREVLLDEVWGHGVNVTDRVVDTHIANLRKKIERHADKPEYVVSVRSIGYRFDG